MDVHKSGELHVGIDAQVLPWRNGGVAHALMALVRALANLPDANERYSLVVDTEEEEEFWRPLLGPNQSLLRKKKIRPVQMRARPKGLRGVVGGAIKSARQWVNGPVEPEIENLSWPDVPISDGFYESLGCDVLHIPWQNFVLCAMPTIYNPHDLQHLHMPHFFTPKELAWKETMYSMGCRFARTVAVGSQWVKDDVAQSYGIDRRKIQVIPEGPQLQLAPRITSEKAEDVRNQYSLPARYIFYPAIMWPHKNHLRLLDALAILRREQGLVVSLVCTGTKHEEFWPTIERRIRDLNLAQQVHCLGFVPESDLRAIQQAACGLVQPSLFEASSLPIFDAWLEEIPVACSRATALPGQVGDAAILFDPLNVHDIACAVAEIMTSAETRRELCARGLRRLGDFDWTRTAKAYRAVYRRTAGLTLNEEDRWLLEWDWMRNPDRSPNMKAI